MMRESIGKSGISDEALAAYFDGEASAQDASAIRLAIDGDPELVAELERLGVMQELTEASLQAAAAEVPQARFEQIWDQIDAAMDQGEEPRASVEAPAGLWSRIKTAFVPVRWPLAAAGAAVAVTLLVVRAGPPDQDTLALREPNTTVEAPSVSPAQDGAAQRLVPPPHKATPLPVTPDNRLAQRPAPEAKVRHPLAPLPKFGGIELLEIDGAGNDVRISNSGTVTVLYIEEDVQEQSSERSL